MPAVGFQLRFLDGLQRILNEGSFNGTYKHALLLALSDLSVELGDDSDAALELPREAVVRKVLEYYLRQARPFAGTGGTGLLIQNNQGANVQIEVACEGRERYGDRPEAILADGDLRRRLVANVFQWPVKHLQNLHGREEAFLFERIPRGGLRLLPGVAFCFRRFHGFVHRLVKGAWVEWIQNQKRNRALVGSNDLYGFLFGSERVPLEPYRRLLREIQDSQCFYCGCDLRRRKSEVDHFVPWSRYSLDLGHNFVLACGRCNGGKRDMLAAAPRFVEQWLERNARHAYAIELYLQEEHLPHDRVGSMAVTRWAYEQAHRSQALLWVPDGEPVAFPDRWAWPQDVA